MIDAARGTSARLRVATLAWMALLLAALHAGCGLSTSGTPREADCVACGGPADCPAAGECLQPSCGANGCCTAVAALAAAPPTQLPGDCRERVCSEGGVDEVLDVDDVEDDINPCTFDDCSADGEPLHSAREDGTPCTQGAAAGTCKLGKCVIGCSATEACPDDGDACTTEVCDVVAAECGVMQLHGVPPPGIADVEGDCRRPLCIDGVEGSVVDDDDLDLTPTDCDEEKCIDGVATNPGLPLGAPCATSGGKLCDGASACVECLSPADCTDLPADDECQKRSCNSQGKCGLSFVAAGTPLSQQQPGDCLEVVCNGAGSALPTPKASDFPDDLQECTVDSCDGIVPKHEAKPIDASCGNGLYCDGSGACVGCTSAVQCSGVTDFCKAPACNGGTCGYTFTPDGTPFPPSQQTTGDCKLRTCDGTGNEEQVPLDADLPIDAFECTNDVCAAGAASNPPKAVNTPCVQGGGQVCTAAGACVQCNDAALHCAPPTEVCKEASCIGNACGVANTAQGTPTALQVGGDCKLSVCDGLGAAQPIENAADIPEDANPCTSDYCSGTAPHNDVLPAGTVCGNGLVCDGSGYCGKALGQPCAIGLECASGGCADGLCCNSPCSGPCQACAAALTGGIDGTCLALPAFSEDSSPACNGPSSCDGAGACKKDSGQPCNLPAECTSTFCADGVCCNADCGAACKACSAAITAGSDGICGNVPALVDDGPSCTGSQTCDGAGSCKLDQGQPCALSADCASGNCLALICAP